MEVFNFYKMFKRRPVNQNYYPNRANEVRSRRSFNSKILAFKNIALKAGIILLFSGIIHWIFFTPALAVKNIIVEGNQAINSDEIKETALLSANQKILKIVNSNLLFIDSADIESAILKRFNNINTVRIEKKAPLTIKIIISEKSADIAWCNKIIVEKIKNVKNAPSDEILPSEIPQCYLSDEEGIIYEKIGDKVIDGAVKVFRDEPIELGIKVSDENLKNFIRKLFNDLNGKTGLKLANLFMLPPASRELHLVTDKNWKIYFDLNRSADEQLDVLNVFLKNELAESDKKNIEYIDLRITDRVYYK